MPGLAQNRTPLTTWHLSLRRIKPNMDVPDHPVWCLLITLNPLFKQTSWLYLSNVTNLLAHSFWTAWSRLLTKFERNTWKHTRRWASVCIWGWGGCDIITIKRIRHNKMGTINYTHSVSANSPWLALTTLSSPNLTIILGCGINVAKTIVWPKIGVYLPHPHYLPPSQTCPHNHHRTKISSPVSS